MPEIVPYAMKAPTIASVNTHTMGNSLHAYLKMKVHPAIQDETMNWKKITILGHHLRGDAASASTIEKKDKPFNWQRPTISTCSTDQLIVHCFPGLDYVHHYASIISTYLSMKGKDPFIVDVKVPGHDECMQPIMQSNLQNLGAVDMIILGYVHGLSATAGQPWEGGDDDQLFAWQTKVMPGGMKIAYVGCRVSFWGDIAGNVIRALKLINSAKCVMYVGKLGSLQEDHAPNRVLAVGHTSNVRGEEVVWDNWLEPLVSGHDNVVSGRHYTLGSVLDESKSWFLEQSSKFDWVDPEIGHMAAAALEMDIGFAYLHIVSDNLARHYKHDLSNERESEVLRHRVTILRDIDDILEQAFEHWDNKISSSLK